MILRNRKICLVILAFLIIASCAKVSSPAGGPRDEQPPRVLEIQPENKSVNFTDRSFRITFDEYFILDNIDQALLISPPLEKRPDIKTRGKTLVVELDEEEKLHDSMTYSFNFLNSIKDLNESNPLENFKYVFSTGRVIDSLSVTGSIYDAYNLEAGEEILVLLHSALPDTMPRTSMPDYITRALDNGRFRIDNITAGEYKIYGLKDANNNKQYDLPTEAFAFLDSSIYVSAENNFIPPLPDSLAAASDTTIITAGDSIMSTIAIDTLNLEEAEDEQLNVDSLKYERIPGNEIELFYFVAENKIQYLTGTSRSLPYLLQFTFSLPVDTASLNMQFADTVGGVNYLREISAGQDTFRIWLTDSAFYSRELITILLEHPETDTLGQLQSVTDTLKLRYRTLTTGRSRRGASEKQPVLPLTTNLSKPTGLKPGEKPVFAFETPVLDPDTSLIRLFLKNDSVRIQWKYKLVRDSLSSKKFIMETRLQPDSSYILVAEKGAFKNIYGLLNDSIVYDFRIRHPDQFGKLAMNITGFKGNIIIQLMDSGEKIVSEKKIRLPDEASIEFPYLDSKEYLVKAIFDIDANGEWTTGDYEMNKQPEPVTYYPKKIDVKAGWEMIEDWQLAGIRKKDDSISTTRGKKAEK